MNASGRWVEFDNGWQEGGGRPLIGISPSSRLRGYLNLDLSPPRLRDYFPETLLWRPELITDDQGRASLDIDLADSITTWRLTAGAVTADGRLGAVADRRPGLPALLRRPRPAGRADPGRRGRRAGRRLELPRRSRSGPPDARGRPWFEPGRRRAASISLAPEVRPSPTGSASGGRQSRTAGHRPRRRQCRRRRQAAGRGRPRRPARRAGLERRSGAGSGLPRPTGMSAPRTERIDWTLPRTPSRERPRRSSRSIRRASASSSRGSTRIFQMPYGCFEQTSSTTYPNVLALDYLRRTGKSVAGGRGQGPAVHPPRLPAAAGLRGARRRLRLVRPAARQPHPDGLRPDGVPGHGPGPRRRSEADRAHPALAARPARSRTARGTPRATVLDDPTARADGRRWPRLGTTAYIAWAVFDGDRTTDAPTNAHVLTCGTAARTRSTTRTSWPWSCNALLALDPSGADAGPTSTVSKLP